jgi:hypothetical protein
MACISTTPFAPSHVPCSTRTVCSADCIMGPIPMEPLTGGATDTINFVLPICSRFAKIHGVQLRACASSAGLIDHTLQELRTSHCSLSLRLGGGTWTAFVMDDALDLTPLLCGSGLCCPLCKKKWRRRDLNPQPSTHKIDALTNCATSPQARGAYCSMCTYFIKSTALTSITERPIHTQIPDFVSW